MIGMIIPGAVMYGGIFDLVAAWDFIVNVFFGSSALSILAKLAAWLAIGVTISLMVFNVLRRINRLLETSLNVVENKVVSLRAACRCRLWSFVADCFRTLAGLFMRAYRWAMNKRK